MGTVTSSSIMNQPCISHYPIINHSCILHESFNNQPSNNQSTITLNQWQASHPDSFVLWSCYFVLPLYGAGTSMVRMGSYQKSQVHDAKIPLTACVTFCWKRFRFHEWRLSGFLVGVPQLENMCFGIDSGVECHMSKFWGETGSRHAQTQSWLKSIPQCL